MGLIMSKPLDDEVLRILREFRRAIGPRKKLGYMRKMYVIK